MACWISPDEARAAIQRGTGRGIRVAVLDSGVEAAHPRLGGLALSDDIVISTNGGVLLQAVPGEGQDVFGHGTAVAGIIRATAPDAEIGSIRVLGEQLAARTAVVRAGAQFAIDHGYHIINCSLGCGVLDHVLQYKSWVDEAYLRGIHIVAACNNFDFSRTEWPGHFASVITVNMVDAPEGRELFYRRGHLVEFGARGVNVPVSWRAGGYKEVSGSSFAAPRVAGLIARLLSEYPEIAPAQLKALLQQISEPWEPEVFAANDLSGG